VPYGLKRNVVGKSRCRQVRQERERRKQDKEHCRGHHVGAGPVLVVDRYHEPAQAVPEARQVSCPHGLYLALAPDHLQSEFSFLHLAPQRAVLHQLLPHAFVGADRLVRALGYREKAAEKVAGLCVRVVDAQRGEAGVQERRQWGQRYLCPKVVADELWHSGERVQVF
jgi:hypothetical protein